MKYKGVIFDFNGTLFWDGRLHVKAWKHFLKKLRGDILTDEELMKNMFGKSNREIIECTLDKVPDDKTIEHLAKQKEQYYRKMCLKEQKPFSFAPGAVELLDYLKKNKIPRTIATMAGKGNIEFYNKHFNLNNWFDIDKIAYDNGFIAGKPAPDIFLKAAENIGLEPGQCIVFEDSISGLEGAKRAKAGKVIVISPNPMLNSDENINDFFEFNKKELITNEN